MAEPTRTPGPLRRGGKPPDFDLLEHNLGMASSVEEFLASTYGPGGRAKLFRNEKGEPRVTTSGARMLEALEGDHPILRLLRAAAATQEEEWGDGTKLTTLFALRLLRRARGLLDQGLRIPNVLDGYRAALDRAVQAANAAAIPVDPTDRAALLDVARIALGALAGDREREALATAVVDAVLQVAESSEDGVRVDRDRVHVFPRVGARFSVELIRGYVLHRTRDYHAMPARVDDARIALFDAEPKRGKAGVHAPRLRWLGDRKIRLRSPGEIEEYEGWADDYTRGLVESLQAAGANVLLCRLGIDDQGHKLLADAGILGIRTLMKARHMDAVAQATGATRVKDFRDLGPEDLGHAGRVEERAFGEEKALVVTGCADPRIVSLVLLGPGSTVAEEYGDQTRQAVGAVAAAVEDPRLVTAGGGAEMAAAGTVREEAPAVGGRKQLAVLAFARALEDLVGILAANLGRDATDAVLALRERHTKGAHWGLAADRGEPSDAPSLREPLGLRLAGWTRAVEVATQVLRVDDFHKTSKGKETPEIPRGLPAATASSPEEDEEAGPRHP